MAEHITNGQVRRDAFTYYETVPRASSASFTRLSDLTPEGTEWVWHLRIPRKVGVPGKSPPGETAARQGSTPLVRRRCGPPLHTLPSERFPQRADEIQPCHWARWYRHFAAEVWSGILATPAEGDDPNGAGSQQQDTGRLMYDTHAGHLDGERANIVTPFARV
jgi:hypothetical protein